MKKFVKIFFFFIFVINNLYNCDTQESEGSTDEKKCCNNVTNQQIVVEFTSTVVEHEYIIHFKEYLKKEERNKHIRTALDNLVNNINYHTSCLRLMIKKNSFLD